MSEITDVLRSRCEHARGRGVESIEVPVEAIQRLLTQCDQLEHKAVSMEQDNLALIDELEQERARG